MLVLGMRSAESVRDCRSNDVFALACLDKVWRGASEGHDQHEGCEEDQAALGLACQFVKHRLCFWCLTPHETQLFLLERIPLVLGEPRSGGEILGSGRSSLLSGSCTNADPVLGYLSPEPPV